MNDVVARLVPMRENNEKLFKNCVERPTLPVWRHPPDQRPLRIGRGSHTGIGCESVSRNAVRITWNVESGTLMLHCPLEQNLGAVLRNQAIVATPATLSHGDVLTVGSNDPSDPTLPHRYRYRVELVNPSESTALSSHEESTEAAGPSNAAAPLSPPTSPPMCPLLFQNGAEEEVQCAVCMELCVETTALVPCSHFFCAACARRLQTCPTCRKKVATKMRLHTVDNLIWKLVQTSCASNTKATVIDGDSSSDCMGDLEMYLQRTNRTLPGSTKAAAKRAASRSQRCRRKKHAVGGGSRSSSWGTTADEAICLD